MLLSAAFALDVLGKVIIAPDTACPQLLKILLISSVDNFLQLLKSKETFMPHMSTDVKEVQFLNILSMLVTEPVLNGGTDVKEVQPLNILFIYLTELVLNSGTDVKDLQL